MNDSLIFLYDNLLIYYPNVFLPLLFLLGILMSILLIKGTVFLVWAFAKITKKVTMNLGKIKSIRQERRKSIWNFFIKINNAFKCLRFQVEKIIIKIKKEVLID
jgi:hypothetical protein